ncbi:MAG: hypothetical protein LBQ21_06375 [Clostridiales Family XIII bacterium]|jgi:GNAT superfamily N-acetyltransferase|nr:hypothetical protein [Clostridiales Family XIII bacterium]
MNTFKLLHIGPENGLAFRPYIQEEYFDKLPGDDWIGLGILTGEGFAAGALVSELTEAGILIRSIFVDESVRLRGGGTKMLNALTALAEKNDQRVLADCVYPTQKETEAWLLRKGFRYDDDGETLFAIDMDAVRESDFLKRKFSSSGKIMMFSDLPAGGRDLMWPHNIPPFADPLNLERGAIGTPIPDATLVCVDKGMVCQSIVCTLLPSGEPYINGLYSEPAYSRGLGALIAAALNALCDWERTIREESGKLWVAAGSEAGLRMIRHILRENPDAAEETIIHRLSLQWKEQNMAEQLEQSAPSLDMIIPKLNGLSELMQDMGIENDIILLDDGEAYISARLRETSPHIETGMSAEGKADDMEDISVFDTRVRYLPGDTNGEGKYILVVMAPVAVSEGEIAAALLCADFNADSYGPVAFSLADVVYIKSCLVENNAPISPEQFSYFWDLFTEAAVKLWDLSEI